MNVIQNQKTTIRAAFALSVIYWTCYAMESSLLVYLAKDLGIDKITFGYLQSITAIAQLISNPFYSRWASKNLKNAVTIAYVSLSAYYFLAAAANGFWPLLISRIANAFGHGPIAAQTAIAASTKSNERTAAFAKLGATVGVGVILGPAVGAAAARTLGLRAPILAAGIACATAAFVGPRFIKVAPQEPEKKQDDKKRGHGLREYYFLIRSRKILVILLAKTMSVAPPTVMLTIFGLYMMEKFGGELGSNAILTIYLGVCMLVMNASGVSFLKKFFGDRGLLLVGATALVLAAIGLIGAGNYYHFFPIFTVLTTGLCLAKSSTDSMLTASVRESDHALVLGLAYAMESLTRIIAPTLAGYMLTRFGFASFGYAQLAGSLGAAVLINLFM